MKENEFVRFDEKTVIARNKIVAIKRFDGKTFVHTEAKVFELDKMSLRMALGRLNGVAVVDGEDQ